MDYPAPLVSVDAVLLTLRKERLEVALHRRPRAPHEGKLALPGGVVHTDKDTSAADSAFRVLRAKTGFSPRYLEQLSTFSGPDRDPRGWSLSVAHLALVPQDALGAARPGVFHVYAVDRLPALAFDHAEIIAAAVERVRNKSSYSSLPCALLPEEFTLSQLQAAYSAVLQAPLDKSSFRRKMDALGFIEPTGGYQEGNQRPARLFRVKDGLWIFDRTI